MPSDAPDAPSGYDALATLKLYTQDPRIDFKAWMAMFGLLHPWWGCGVCQQCKDSTPLHPHLARKKLKLFCVEPLPANHRLLNSSASHMHLDELGLQVVHGAFTNRETVHALRGQFYLPSKAQLAGSEGFGIGVTPRQRRTKGSKKQPAEQLEYVPLFVLDDFAAVHALRHIDILSIDTEGSDPHVLYGAKQVLQDRVSYVEFEYHKIGRQFHSVM